PPGDIPRWPQPTPHPSASERLAGCARQQVERAAPAQDCPNNLPPPVRRLFELLAWFPARAEGLYWQRDESGARAVWPRCIRAARRARPQYETHLPRGAKGYRTLHCIAVWRSPARLRTPALAHLVNSK